MRRGLHDQGMELGREDARWLDEHVGRGETAVDAGGPFERHSGPLYEQTRRAAGLHDDRRQQ